MNKQLCASTALYLGAALLSVTALTTIYISKAGITPVLFILFIFLVVCFLLSSRVANPKERKALAISGSFSALGCHFMLTWFISHLI